MTTAITTTIMITVLSPLPPDDELPVFGVGTCVVIVFGVDSGVFGVDSVALSVDSGSGGSTYGMHSLGLSGSEMI